MIARRKPRFRGDGKGITWPVSRTGVAPALKSIFGPRPFSTHIPTVGYDYDFHRGIDIPAAYGTPIYSPISGSISRMHWTHFTWEAAAQLERWEEVDAASSTVWARVSDLLQLTASRVGAQTFPTNVGRLRPLNERIQIQSADWLFEVELSAAPSLAAGGVGLALLNSDDSEYVALEYDGSDLTIRGVDGGGVLTSDGDVTAIANQTWLRITYTQATDTLEWLCSVDGDTWTSLGTEATHSFTLGTLPVFQPVVYWRSGDTNATPYTISFNNVNWYDDQTIPRFGNWLEICDDTQRFILLHFRDFISFSDRVVHPGQLLGYMGASGLDSRSGRVLYPHAHLEHVTDNEFFYDNDQPTNALAPGVMPRANVSNNVSVVRDSENDPDGVDSHHLEITITRADQDFDLNTITLTGSGTTRTVNFNTRAGLNADNDVPKESGVYIVANTFTAASTTYVLDVYFNKSVVGNTFTSYLISDTAGTALASEG